MTTLFVKYTLTGGTDDSLDSIPDCSLTSSHFAFVVNSGTLYSYRYDPASAAAENSPDVIRPDNSTGNGRWLLVPFYGTGGLGAPAQYYAIATQGSFIMSNGGWGITKVRESYESVVGTYFIRISDHPSDPQIQFQSAYWVDFTSDSRWLAIVYNDDTSNPLCRIIDIEAWDWITAPTLSRPSSSKPICCSFSPAGTSEMLAVVYDDAVDDTRGSVEIFNTDDWSNAVTNYIEDNATYCKFSNTGDYFLMAIGGEASTIIIKETATWTTVKSYTTQIGENARFSPDDSMLAMPSADADLEVYTTSDWNIIAGLPSVAAGPIVTVDWSGTGAYLAASSGNSVVIYNTSNWSVYNTINTGQPVDKVRFIYGTTQILVVDSNVNTYLRCYDIVTGNLLHRSYVNTDIECIEVAKGLA